MILGKKPHAGHVHIINSREAKGMLKVCLRCGRRSCLPMNASAFSSVTRGKTCASFEPRDLAPLFFAPDTPRTSTPCDQLQKAHLWHRILIHNGKSQDTSSRIISQTRNNSGGEVRLELIMPDKTNA